MSLNIANPASQTQIILYPIMRNMLFDDFQFYTYLAFGRRYIFYHVFTLRRLRNGIITVFSQRFG